jgi:hypothetical protein
MMHIEGVEELKRRSNSSMQATPPRESRPSSMHPAIYFPVIQLTSGE